MTPQLTEKMDLEEFPTLNLNRLSDGSLKNLDKTVGAYLKLCSEVALTRQSHTSPTRLNIGGLSEIPRMLYWNIPKEGSGRNFDEEEPTWKGAEAIAILLIEDLTVNIFFQSAYKGGGFDFWLTSDENGVGFQNASRLEVSGIACSKDNQFESRIRQKQKQISKSDQMNLPGYVVVVDFGEPKAAVIES